MGRSAGRRRELPAKVVHVGNPHPDNPSPCGTRGAPAR